MNKTYLLLGSNMGNSQMNLSKAIEYITGEIGQVVRRSGIYVTEAWGNKDQADFLNQVVTVETTLSAMETLENILAIEQMMGRIRTVKNAPRAIDIDILFFNKEIIFQNELIVPHPEIQNRRFVLVPLNELSPGMRHPILNKTIGRLLIECKDKLSVKKF